MAAVAMFALPLAADVERSGGFVGTIKLFPQPRAGFARRTDPRYARHLLHTPSAELVFRYQALQSAVSTVPPSVKVFRSVGRSLHGHRTYRTLSMRVVAPTPGQAAASAINAMLAVEYASEIDLVAHARKRLKSRRYSDNPRQRAMLRAVIRHPQPRFAIQRGPIVGRTASGPIDRLVARLPGHVQGRPLAWAAAGGGLLLTAALWLASTARLPVGLARRERRPDPEDSPAACV